LRHHRYQLTTGRVEIAVLAISLGLLGDRAQKD